MDNNDWIMVAVLVSQGIFFLGLIGIVYLMELRVKSRIKYCLENYLDNADQIIDKLKKYRYSTYNLTPKRNWKFYLKLAYQTLLTGEIEGSVSVEIDKIEVNVIPNKTNVFYKELESKDDQIKNLLQDEVLQSLEEVLAKCFVDFNKPFQIDPFEFQGEVKYITLKYPVYGQILNNSSYLFNTQLFKEPIKIGNCKIWIRENYLDLEGDLFIIDIEINAIDNNR
ncbi:hypothetical protein [Haloplasma contractile]|nr:hypothetical protein [Haloplasma contractile]